MQLQIECNYTPLQKRRCLICDEQFVTTEAKVIACNDQGKSYGEVCPACLKEGFDWLSDRFDQINQSQRVDVIRHVRSQKMLVGA